MPGICSFGKHHFPASLVAFDVGDEGWASVSAEVVCGA